MTDLRTMCIDYGTAPIDGDLARYDAASGLWKPASTDWTDFTPTITASGSMTVSSVNNRQNRYRKVMGQVEFECTNDYTLGGTISTSIFISFPIAISGHQANVGFICAADDGAGGAVAGGGRWRAESTPRIHLFKPGAANWALGAGGAHSIKGSFKAG